MASRLYEILKKKELFKRKIGLPLTRKETVLADQLIQDALIYKGSGCKLCMILWPNLPPADTISDLDICRIHAYAILMS